MAGMVGFEPTYNRVKADGVNHFATSQYFLSKVGLEPTADLFVKLISSLTGLSQQCLPIAPLTHMVENVGIEPLHWFPKPVCKTITPHSPFGWDGVIRTHECQSQSLMPSPLGDTPIYLPPITVCSLVTFKHFVLHIHSKEQG